MEIESMRKDALWTRYNHMRKELMAKGEVSEEEMRELKRLRDAIDREEGLPSVDVDYSKYLTD